MCCLYVNLYKKKYHRSGHCFSAQRADGELFFFKHTCILLPKNYSNGVESQVLATLVPTLRILSNFHESESIGETTRMPSL